MSNIETDHIRTMGNAMLIRNIITLLHKWIIETPATLYRNEFIRHGFLCRCACHERSNIVNSKSRQYKILTSIADVKNEIVNISERGRGPAELEV